MIAAVGGAPCVIKLLEGTQGMGVILAETTASAVSIIEAFSAASMNILVQEFIKEAGGNDIRALRRRQHGDNDANDRDGNDDTDRDNHAQTGAIPTGVLPRIGSARTSHSRHG